MADQNPDSRERAKETIAELQAMKREKRKITLPSIQDYPLGLLAERAGLDMILVGDSAQAEVLESLRGKVRASP